MTSGVSSLEKFKEVGEKLNQVGKGFCLAKWNQVSILLQTGQTHSCHHPSPHYIPLEEIEKNPSALHNTRFKKLQRKTMLKGGRPKECDYCWNVEDSNQDSFSDRFLKSGEGWAWPQYDTIRKMKGNEDIFPKYVEISFSNQCNMACAYCDVKSSSRWQSEILSQGHYPTSGMYNNTEWMERLPISYTKPNPYVDAFWRWWPDLFPNLHTFRITGGEPLLQKDTFKVLDYIIENPKVNPQIELGINSNLSVPNELWDEFVDKVKYITDNQLVSNFILFTSIEASGKRAEYIRDGLDIDLLWERVNKFLTKCEKPAITIMSTFNALSVSSYESLIEKVYETKRMYMTNNRYRDYSMILDTSYLRHPNFLDFRILTDDFYEKIISLEQKMVSLGMQKYKHEDGYDEVGWFDFEHEKVRRMGDMRYTEDEWLNTQRKDFVLFIDEYDKRRKKDFLKTFPEYKDFYNLCKSL